MQESVRTPRPPSRRVRLPLLGERAGVRGNETPPTKTAGGTLQALLDRFPESADCATKKTNVPTRLKNDRRKQASALVVRASLTPHPSPPVGSGRIARRAWANQERLDSSRRGLRCSLSLGERARVR